ncbi:MAG: UvrD-helicase domain-containing protein [Pseudomonadota bacterium]
MSGNTGTEPLQATEPTANASVHASAGTGKTWLLTTRIIRLLLAGARPDGILAVTFTRKAAAEMQQRITERLREMMSVTAENLDTLLSQCGIRPDDEIRDRARYLYEELLFHPYPLRTTTFHAFCQELLQRFPLEAGVPPGFVISESTGLIEQTARDALLAQTATDPDSPVARALDELVERCNGLANAGTALKSFLARRSDWWAWTQGQPDACRYATESLSRLLDTDAAQDPLINFPDTALGGQLREFATLLAQHNTRTNRGHADSLASVLTAELTAQAKLDTVSKVFFKTDGEPRARQSSKAQGKSLGADNEARLIELDQAITAELDRIRDRVSRYNTLRTGMAWYTAGMQLLEHYQRIKQEQRLLDFSDLEWRACELLNQSEHASWVQYKLDTRIEHLLVDEFQDTNPTQWRLLLPLLQELAAGNNGRERSVFLVGDIKQSIYSFRRARPALMTEASDWLHVHLQASNYSLDASRRSARAVMDAVNAVFGTGPLHALLTDFNPHQTHLPDMHGAVEVLPLCPADPAVTGTAHADGLRNPLTRPRLISNNQGYYNEGNMIAARIRTLLDNNTLVTDGDSHRPMHCGDIMILLRQRTHAQHYENALRDNGIAYLSASKSVLLDTLEVRDLEALLKLLISPYDNLALAQVLRAPLFNLDSEALLPLAALGSGTWHERLAQLATRDAKPYTAIYDMLERWRSLVGQLPVHDLLDRIYHDADVMQRYISAYPPALRPRVQASLTRFIELALEVDHGRYPSLPRFLDQLTRLRQSDQDQPEEGTPEDDGSQRVRIMTIHGAKGLEAPVVFIADAAVTPRDRNAWTALVDWPAAADRPENFLLTGSQGSRDPVTDSLVDTQALDARREDANLLYVAMTRARQYLFISATESSRQRNSGWYGQVREAAANWELNADGNPHIVTGTPALPSDRPQPQTAEITLDPRLSQPVSVTPILQQIAPSHTAQAGAREDGDADGRERGSAIHLMLEQLARNPESDGDTLYPSLATAVRREPGDADLQAWWQEAVATFRAPQFAHLFDQQHYQQAYSEVPVQYLDGKRLVYGIIDRLVLQADTVLVVDYKTHRSASSDTIPALVDNYREQMALYSEAVRRLWPEHEVKPCLLFTACNTLVEVC